MPYEEALVYHQKGLDDGSITVCVEDGEVLGYYERTFIGSSCFLKNIYIKKDERQGRVIKQLKKVFFGSMPDYIENVVGEKQKLKGKFVVAKIRR